MTNNFGTTQSGETVQRITIGTGELSVSLLTLGTIIQDVRLRGIDHSLTLGSSELAAYEGPMSNYGALVGPVANRIANGTAEIAGTRYHFETNEKNVTLHGGPTGTHKHVWTLVDHGSTFAEFTLALPDGLGGFPGNRKITARYTITAPASLTLRVTATTDAPTIMNLANHSYWNLDGTPQVTGHKLRIAADRYNPIDAQKIPTGIAPVEGTAFDYRTPRSIGADSPDRIDHNLCLSDARTEIRRVAELTGSNGVTLAIDTTEPGLQVYDAEFGDTNGFVGHHGAPYGPLSGIALEAQIWPDAPNQKDFPNVSLSPGEIYEQITRWTFQH